MEPQARYTVVGSAIIVLLILLGAAILWLTRAGKEGEGDQYIVYFANQSLSGLQVDSWVTMRGIKVGNVKSLHILSNDIERVKVVVKLQAGTPVKTDTKAVIQRNLLTGLAQVDLTGSTQGAPRLVVPPPGERYPVIPEGRTGLERLQSTLPELVENADRLLQKAHAMFSEENQKAVAEIIGALKSIATQVAGQEGDLLRLVSGLADLSVELKQAARESREYICQLTRAFINLTETLDRQVNLAGQNWDRAAQKLSAAAERFQDPRAAILGPAPSALGPGEDN